MKVTKIDIVGYAGENRRPVSGDATFDHGRFYDWLIASDGSIRFFTTRSTHQGTGRSLISFDSPKRAQALKVALA